MSAPASRPRTLADLARLLRASPSDPGAAGLELRGLADDSRDVGRGDVFFARRGSRARGRDFVADARSRGAVVVVADEAPEGEGPFLLVDDVPTALRSAADAWFGRPQDALRLVGITGTKGKTTVAHVATQVLRRAGRPTAVLGTIGHDLGDAKPPRPTETTTPGALALRRLLAEARDAGVTTCVMEVSSHALDQGRTTGLAFDVAVLTNVASDHLDYHVSHEAYVAAKRRLVEELAADATALLPSDDAQGAAFAAATPARVVTYGTAVTADLRMHDLAVGPGGSRFSLSSSEGVVDVSTLLVGRHNALNVTAALGICRALGVRLADAARHVAAVRGVRGRLERIEGAADVAVFVDYAHTEDALRQVLAHLRATGAAPLVCVIGCGGDRDRTKRPRMAAAACAAADLVVLTSDNPRSEDPRAILAEMEAGVPAASRHAVRVVPDRRAAIEIAIGEAPAGATVLLAGKGHETVQVLGPRRIPFDDAAEARRALALRASAAAMRRPGAHPGQDEV
ncbi:MAG: UDP-N-acetylmuramoyl-L-alanyl-D-glutamate--2,6-diaminopimelate ligase [Planctomycetota bacterium]